MDLLCPQLTRVLLVVLSLLLHGCSWLSRDDPNGNAAAKPLAAPTIGAEITGIDGPLADNVLAHLSVSSKPCDVARAYIDALETRTHEEATSALQAYGYYSPTVSARIVERDPCPVAEITVDPGEPVVVGEVRIGVTGAAEHDAEFRAQVAAIPIKSGEPLNHANYTGAKQLIESVALERGYLEGVFTRSILKVNPAAKRADIELQFSSGPRYNMGELRITQEPDFLDQALILRFLDDTGNEPYTAARVVAFQHGLSKGSYFNEVEVTPRFSATEGQSIPIDIRLTPRDKHAINTGIGVSTDEGIRGRFGYQNRRLNRYGHQLNLGANASLIEQKFTAGYSLPRVHPVDEWLTFQAGVRRRDVDSFDTIETQLTVSETKRRPWGWMETRFIELNREDYDVASTDRSSSFLAPGISWERTTSDHDLFPTRGYGVNFEIKGAADSVLSDTSFLRSTLDLSAIYGLPFDIRAVLRSRFGAMWVDDFKVLPPSERFFAGGDNSIRGYEIEELGPVDRAGDVIGGTYLGILSIELEHYFMDNWGIAAFVDSGNAFGGDGRSTGLQTGFGVGARWRSPIGPVRVDIAHPLDDANNDFRIHLRIGPDL